MYIETSKDGSRRQLTFKQLMHIFTCECFACASQFEQEMRWDGKVVTLGGTNPTYFKRYHWEPDKPKEETC